MTAPRTRCFTAVFKAPQAHLSIHGPLEGAGAVRFWVGKTWPQMWLTSLPPTHTVWLSQGNSTVFTHGSNWSTGSSRHCRNHADRPILVLMRDFSNLIMWITAYYWTARPPWSTKFSLVRRLTSVLCQRWSRVKLGAVISEWANINAGVPQQTLLGPVWLPAPHQWPLYHQVSQSITWTTACLYSLYISWGVETAYEWAGPVTRA